MDKKFFFAINNKGNFLKVIKVIYKNPTATIILIGERWNVFPLRAEQNMDVYSHHFNSYHTRGSKQFSQAGKRNRRHQVGSEDVNISLFADSIILNVENPREFI